MPVSERLPLFTVREPKLVFRLALAPPPDLELHMDWITERVAIGNYLDAQNPALIKQHAFRSVLSLDGTLSSKHAVEYGLAEVSSYDLKDGPGNSMRTFQRAVRDLHRLAEHHPPVLVNCHAGRSRSAVVVAAFLIAANGLSAGEAMAAVAAKRDVNITAELVSLLHQWDALTNR